MDPCEQSGAACAAEATCDVVEGGVACRCRDGFAGDGLTCVDIDECVAADTCHPQASCNNEPGGFSCECHDGFAGDGVDCVDVDECADGQAACDEHATCKNLEGAYSCACDPGFEGDGTICHDIDECATDQDECHPAAECINELGFFTCTCTSGYEGDGFFCDDIDECAVANGGCHELATCTNLEGGFSCACPAGYVGDGTSCTDVDECATDNGGCDANATCTNTPGGHTCSCNAGFTGDGTTCVDINECATNQGGCAVNATCLNQPGSHSCTCDAGYTGDGVTCSDIDECATNNGGCDPNASCTNIPGSSSCACDQGFTGDGASCVDVDECATANGGCDVNAACTNLPGSHSCACDTGFSGDGITCADVDECATNNGGCDANATCTNLLGGFACSCNHGFVGNGQACTCAAPAPVADAGQNAEMSLGAAHPLNASGTTGGSGTLSFSWSALGDAPVPTDPNAVYTTVAPTDCGTYSYQVTVTDKCGQTSVDSVQIVVKGTGPHVSATTCSPSAQCGTVSKPWCGLPEALALGTGPEIYLAAGTYVHGPISLNRNVTLLGGYPPTFDGPRNPDPATNGVVLVASTIQWLPGIAATLDGIHFDPSGGGAFMAAGVGAHVTLTSFRLQVASPGPYGTVKALSVVDATVTLGPGVEITTPNGSTESVALHVAGGNAPITISESTLVAGDAPTSRGIWHEGSGALSIQDSVVQGGAGSAVWGIFQEFGDLTITGSTIEGGQASASQPNQAFATGIELGPNAQVFLTSAHVIGGTGTGGARAAGLYLQNDPGDLRTHVTTIVGSTIEGGTQWHESRAIVSEGLALDISSSTIVGSSAAQGNAVTACGVCVVDGAAPGVLIDIHDNVEITGVMGSQTANAMSAGISIDTEVDALIANNALVRGCGGACLGTSSGIAGISAAGPSSLEVAGNVEITGGDASSYTAGIRVVDSPHPAPTVVHIHDNPSITAAPTNATSYGTGIYLDNVEGSIERNTASGKGGSSFARGLDARHSSITIAENLLMGGDGHGYALALIENTDVVAYRNEGRNCRLPPTNGMTAAGCGGGGGLHADKNISLHLFNNYFFGAMNGDGTGCQVYGCSGCTTLFEHNLCFAEGKNQVGNSAIALLVSPFNQVNVESLLFRNNILDAGLVGFNRTGLYISVNSGPSLQLQNNGVVISSQNLNDCVSFRGTCHETIEEFETYVTGATDNFLIEPSYVGSPGAYPTAADFHLDASCVPAGTAMSVTTVIDDYDGEPRGVAAEIGPDECP